MDNQVEGRIYAYISVVTLFLLGFCYFNFLLGVSNTQKLYHKDLSKPIYSNTKVYKEPIVVNTDSYINKQDIKKFVETLKVA